MDKKCVDSVEITDRQTDRQYLSAGGIDAMYRDKHRDRAMVRAPRRTKYVERRRPKASRLLALALPARGTMVLLI